MENSSSDTGLDGSFAALKSVVAHPVFQRVLLDIQRLPPLQRAQATFTQLTVQALVAHGVPVPAGMSIVITATQRSARTLVHPLDVPPTHEPSSEGQPENLAAPVLEDAVGGGPPAPQPCVTVNVGTLNWQICL